VLLSAQERYDIGLYFALDGDPNGDGALTGDCSISTLSEDGSFTRADGSTGDFVDLDSTCKGGRCPQPEDLCGDIDKANNPIFYDLAATGNYITAFCIANENGRLNLPNCTSWRQSGANEVCLDPTNAFPGSPSKCNCQPEFEVPINVPPAELKVVKTASPTSVDEPGRNVTFSVSVTNTGIDPGNAVTLDAPGGLTDNIYGDITTVGHDGITATTCSVPQTLSGNGGTYTCTFSVDIFASAADSPNPITDIVTAWGVDDRGSTISGSDDATVIINNVDPNISVTKTANLTSVLEGSKTLVTFTVKVDNDSTADPLTITSLTDSIHGVLSTSCLDADNQPLAGQTIPIRGSVTCTFSAVVDGPAFSPETDTVTVVGEDDEGNSDTASDSATVTILDDTATIKLIKTASPESFNEPGAHVTYSFTVNNLSAVDTVTIDSLMDTVYGDLTLVKDNTCSVSQVLGPLENYSCEITVFVPGDPGPGNGYVEVLNVATARGFDDDGQPVMSSDDATVTISDVPPAASLTKTATNVLINYEITVTNDSAAEALTLDVLEDDVYGDITNSANPLIDSTTCVVPQTLAPNGQAGDTYTCSFQAWTDTSPTIDTVAGTLSDDEGGEVTPFDCAEVTFGDPATCPPDL
jgi:hypothetical protein